VGNISYWITGIVSIIVAALGSSWLGVWINSKREKKTEIYKKIDEIETDVNKHIEVVEKALTGIEYLGIKMSCSHILDRGYVTIEELEDIEKLMYKPYTAMGGNGVAKELFEEIKRLPHKPKKEE
jgi:hypothetical protein